MIQNKKQFLYNREYIVIIPTILLNLAWVILASFLSIGVVLKRFNVKIENESIWAISGLSILLLLFAFNSWKYGEFLFGAVYVYFCFALFDKYFKLSRDCKKILLNIYNI